jgi:type I restriction enzyme M protein
VLVPELADAARQSIAERWLGAVERVAETESAITRAEARLLELLQDTEGEVQTDRAQPSSWVQPLATLRANRRIDPEFSSPAVDELRRRLVTADGVLLSSLVLSVRKGVQPQQYVEDGEVRVVKSKDVHYPDLDLSACDRTTDDGWPYRLEGGELLINMTGQGTLGRSTVVPKADAVDGTLISAIDVCALDVDRTVVLPEYVALVLNSPLGRQLTEALQTGSSGQQHLYPAHFAMIPIPVPRTPNGEPDLQWQQETVAIAEARTSALESARAVGQELDDEFLDHLGVPVDLSILPF